jgi:hypothetical protein
MESEAKESREAWLKAVERFSKILEEQLEQARARPDSDEEEIRYLLQIQLKLLTLWKKQIPNARESSKVEEKTRWIRRVPETAPQESSVGQTG